MDDFNRINGEHSYDENLAAVNPNYSTGKKEWRNNCQRCVVTYDARRKGYDVEALSATLPLKNDELATLQKLSSVYDSPILISCNSNTGVNTKKKVIEYMRELGDGARAIIQILWKGKRSGHAFIAEQRGNDTVFLDPQSNNSNVEEYFNRASKTGTFLLRIDNLNFTGIIKKCCKNRDGGK